MWPPAPSSRVTIYVADRPELVIGGPARPPVADPPVEACSPLATGAPPALALTTVEQHVHVTAGELVTEVGHEIRVIARHQKEQLGHFPP